MKTTMFTGSQMQIECRNKLDGRISSVSIPTLSAYAVEYAEFIPPRHIDAGYIQFDSGTDFEIVGNKIQFSHGFIDLFHGFETCRLIIHYHGIRDYEALFPQIQEKSLRTRLSEFYQEAETTFEHSAWLAFALMSTAIYEGLLIAKLNLENEELKKLIDKALSNNIITQNEADTLHRTREFRNLVHAGRCRDPYVRRADAMNLRTTLDGLIRKLSSTL